MVALVVNIKLVSTDSLFCNLNMLIKWCKIKIKAKPFGFRETTLFVWKIESFDFSYYRV